MAARLAPYLRYYSTHRPIDDHGVQPSVLVVLRDDIAVTHFLRVAREEMDRVGVEVPLSVSHEAALEDLGPLGLGWRIPKRKSKKVLTRPCPAVAIRTHDSRLPVGPAQARHASGN